MAVRITGSNLRTSRIFTGYTTYLYTSSLSSTITVSFDGAGSGTGSYPFESDEYYDYIKITRQDNEITYKTTSKSITFNTSDFGYLSTSSIDNAYVTLEIGHEDASSAPTLTLGDVYFNGTKIDTVKHTYFSDSYTIKISLDPNIFKPVINSFSAIALQSGGWNGYPVAGEAVMQVATVTFGNAVSSDPNNYFYVYTSISGGGGGYNDKEVTRVNNNTIKITNIVTPTSEESSYTLSVTVSITNRYGAKVEQTKSVTIYPYHLPRLVLNQSGAVSYVARCQQDGSADGLGTYGHLHLVWDVSKINTTGSGTVNILQSATVVLNGGTTLSPKSGSISAGYFDYIFPLAIETQGNLSIILTDTRKTNTITGLCVPKGSMPLSLYDDGSNVGVAFGCMATSQGAWMYMPFYIQSATSGSTKMFRLCVYDDGTIKAVAQ